MKTADKTDAQLTIEVRHRLDLTQTELAQLLGATQATICRWEKGHEYPNPWRRMVLEAIYSSAKKPDVRRLLMKRGTMYTLGQLLPH